ncbi:hypothetical protein CBOM_07806 [Ceraceosorus bombacis]|uniref:Uncharacterized protein n=1 Tax=Ceraceosorus bombacis TaxID=401625 RepID=A0A0N7LAZ3_9BASI|nr:hypothetical protein CBOM_07806 [Ceraceosorus bombacis]
MDGCMPVPETDQSITHVWVCMHAQHTLLTVDAQSKRTTFITAIQSLVRKLASRSSPFAGSAIGLKEGAHLRITPLGLDFSGYRWHFGAKLYTHVGRA